MSIIAILQARMSSSRLPGKVLKPILGKPMLAHQIARLQRVQQLDNIVVATSDQPGDDDIALLCQQLKVDCFRGSLTDVLDRYYQASLRFPSEHVVRVTGDCPVIDPDIVDEVIALHLSSAVDYTSNCLHPSYPDGLDVEIFTQRALHQAWQQADKVSEREHVTPYIYQNTQLFSRQELLYPQDFSHYRWTVDQAEDFQLVTLIFEQLYPKNNQFNLADMLKLLERQPELATINEQFFRNEGLLSTPASDEVTHHD